MGFGLDIDEEVERRWPGLSTEEQVSAVTQALEQKYDALPEDKASQLFQDFGFEIFSLRELNSKYDLGISEELLKSAESIDNPDPPKGFTQVVP